MDNKMYGMYVSESGKVSLTVKFYFRDSTTATWNHIKNVVVEDGKVKMYTGNRLHTMNLITSHVKEYHIEIVEWS